MTNHVTFEGIILVTMDYFPIAKSKRTNYLVNPTGLVINHNYYFQNTDKRLSVIKTEKNF